MVEKLPCIYLVNLNFRSGGDMQKYRIYEKVIGIPLKTINEELEECLEGYTAKEAEDYIEKHVPKTDIYGREVKVYVHRLD